VVICLERGADLYMAQLMPLPPTVSCFSKVQIGFTFLVPAHPGSPAQRAVKRVCVCVCVYLVAKIGLNERCSHVDDQCADVNARCRGVGLPCVCTGSYSAVADRCRTLTSGPICKISHDNLAIIIR